jgi:chromosome segregation ATPase
VIDLMDSVVTVVEHPRPDRGVFAERAGVIVVVLSVVGLLAGLFLVQSVADEARASVSVSRSALEAMRQTVDLVDDVAADTAASLDSASGSVAQVSATVEQTVTALETMAAFLETELPETLETVRTSMPAAIQTADAVDSTLRALSLFGVGYDPEEPFGESLARVDRALASLPAEVRAQGEAMRELIPSASQLVEESDALATSMTGLEQSLDGFGALTEDYEATLTEAETTIATTDTSMGTSIWILRALILVAGLLGVLAGAAITTLGRQMTTLAVRVEALDSTRESEVPA